MTDYRKWLTKAQAAEQLGVSQKTIQRYADAGTLERAEAKRPGAPVVAVYRPQDVERLKKERERGKVYERVLEVVDTSLSSPIAPATPAPSDALAALLARIAPAPLPLFLTVAEAVEYSGLPASFLRREIREGRLPALKSGAWRISRAALVNFANRDAWTDAIAKAVKNAG